MTFADQASEARRPTVAGLRCENLINPLAVTSRQPRLSWQFHDARQGAGTSAYQIEVATELSDFAAGQLHWDSGRQNAPTTATISYAGPPLRKWERYFWRVRVWDHARQVTPWSEPASWGVGPAAARDWQAQWITPPSTPRATANAAPVFYLQRKFTAPAAFRRATLHFSALGVTEFWINGTRITPDCFLPGWSDYRSRAQSVAYDVTDLVQAGGANAIGAVLAAGWYAAPLAWPSHRHRYGDSPALLAQLVLDTVDGPQVVVATDPHWRCRRGPVIDSSLYDGERYDARREIAAWATVTEAMIGAPARPLRGAPPPLLTAKRSDSVREQRTLDPVQIRRASSGEWIVDFGQNIVGRARIRLRVARGTTVTLRFAEMVTAEGDLYLANLRSAKATDVYIAKGGGTETWEPRFTFHGFRYVGVSGLRAAPAPADITAVVLHTAMPAAGEFACSDPLLNRLQQNIVWGQRGNFLEIPTDCPQRDERLGWTGDAQVFFRTAAFNMDVAAFFEKWLDDLADGQRPDGAVPDVAPDILPGEKNAGNAGWADAAVICPWRLYVETGDPTVLERHLPLMRKWIDYQKRTSRALIRPATVYGDWLAIDAPRPEHAPTPSSLIGTAYFAYTTHLVARATAVLGRKREAAAWQALHRRIVRAFQLEFTTPQGRVVGETQTGYALALAFDLLPTPQRPTAVEHLVRLIEERGNTLTTGFIGTPLLCPVLSRFGRSDVAHRLVRQESHPSWLSTVKLGATTMWERWNSFTAEQGFGDAGMNSFNHYAYGAVGEWLYAKLGGIAPDEAHPGYRLFQCAPCPTSDLTWARAWHDTPRGRIGVEWRQRAGRFSLTLVVPPDTAAAVTLPGAHIRTVRANDRPLRRAAGVSDVQAAGDQVTCRATSGSHHFEYPRR